jgi:hypothetical protein
VLHVSVTYLGPVDGSSRGPGSATAISLDDAAWEEGVCSVDDTKTATEEAAAAAAVVVVDTNNSNMDGIIIVIVVIIMIIIKQTPSLGISPSFDPSCL